MSDGSAAPPVHDTGGSTTARAEPYRVPLPALDQLPAALVDLPIWCCYRHERESGKAKPKKPPISPRNGGRTAGWKSAEFYVDVKTALAYAARYQHPGIGLRVPDGWVLVDLDHHVDPRTGALDATATGIIEELRAQGALYAEVSPGLDGAHLLVRGDINRTYTDHARGVEVYGAGQFLTITGLHLPGSSLKPSHHGDLSALASRWTRRGAMAQGDHPAGPASPERGAEAPCALDQITGLSEHDRQLILRGIAKPARNEPGIDAYDGDRSRAVYAAMRALATASANDQTILDLLTDPAHGISRAALERGDGDPARARAWLEPQLAKLRAQLAADTAADLELDDWDPVSPPPQLDPLMLHGLIGEIARAGAEGAEPSPVAIAAAALVWFSSQIGRDIGLMIGNTMHPLIMFGLHVGRTAIARKGDSVSLVKRIGASIKARHEGAAELFVAPDDDAAFDPDAWIDPRPQLLGQTHSGGLSSLEGLAALVQDPVYSRAISTEIKEQGRRDKRLLVQESEFGNVLKQGMREGNTLSHALRCAWDGEDIKPLTKHAQTFASSPHIALLGAVTPHELREQLSAGDVANGLMNRMLMYRAERVRSVAWPVPTPQEQVDALADRALDVLLFARGSYPSTRYRRTVDFSQAARDLYAAVYPELSAPIGGAVITALLARQPAITLRLASLFAVIDQTLIVDEQHLRAAIAWSEYHEQSVRYVFGGKTRDSKDVQRNRLKERVLDTLQGGDWVARSVLTNKLSKLKGGDAATLDLIITQLLEDGRIERREEQCGGANPHAKKASYRLQDPSV